MEDPMKGEAAILSTAHSLVDQLNSLMREYNYTNTTARGVIELRNKMTELLYNAAERMENI